MTAKSVVEMIPLATRELLDRTPDAELVSQGLRFTRPEPGSLWRSGRDYVVATNAGYLPGAYATPWAALAAVSLPRDALVRLDVARGKGGAGWSITEAEVVAATDMSLGGILRNQRLRLGLDTAEVANRVGCTVKTLGRIERGENEPSALLCRSLARALNLNPDVVTFAAGRTPEDVQAALKADPYAAANYAELIRREAS